MIGSVDFRETRVPIVIPFAIFGAFEVVQLFLGADPVVVVLSLAGILVTFLPLHFNGRDLYSLLAMVFGLRYLGFALIVKTVYGQPLQKHLFDPIPSHAWVLVLLSLTTLVFMLVRRLDRGVETFAIPHDPKSLRRLAIVSFLIGVAALGVVARSLNSSTGGGVGGVILVANYLQNLIILAFAAEASRNLAASGGRNLFSPLLIGMVLVTFFGVSALNIRGFFINCLVGIVIVAFAYRAIRLRYVIVGALFVAFFTSFLTPLILYTRAQRSLPLVQFVQFSMDTAYKAATDPAFMRYIKDIADGKSESINDVEYDYYGNRSNVWNRLSFIALFDSIYQANKTRVPLGFLTVRQSLRGVLPGFLGYEKNPESLGDWLGWQTGVIEAGATPFINFGMPMEGYTAWRGIGVILYPFIFLFPFIFVFSKIASFRLVVPSSIYVFSSIQHPMIEATSDGFLNVMTRGAIIVSVALFLLQYGFFRKRRRMEAVEAQAQT